MKGCKTTKKAGEIVLIITLGLILLGCESEIKNTEITEIKNRVPTYNMNTPDGHDPDYIIDDWVNCRWRRVPYDPKYNPWNDTVWHDCPKSECKGYEHRGVIYNPKFGETTKSGIVTVIKVDGKMYDCEERLNNRGK